MVISHSKKFIFIHVYKVAGTSIRAALRPFNDKNLFFSPLSSKWKMMTGEYPIIFSDDFPHHIRAKELREELPDEIFDEYFKFAFVRNPWSWQVSLYNYARMYPSHHQYEITNRLGSFENYLKWRTEHEPRFQKHFVTDDDGTLIVDHIGKIENLEDNFRVICRKAGLGDIKLPHKNISTKRNYLEFYSQETIDLVADFWSEDIDMFGYDKPEL